MENRPGAAKLAQLHRSQKLARRQLQIRTVELERINDSLKAQVARHRCAENEINFLFRLSQEIALAQDFRSAADSALRWICAATGWACGEVWLPAGEKPVLVYGQGWYGEDPTLEQFKKQSQNFSFPPGTGVPGSVWVSKRPEWVRDISVEPHAKYPRCGLAKQFGLRSTLGIPVLASGQVIAVLVFFMAEAREKDKCLVDLVSFAAAQLGILLQHKQAEQALREREALLQSIIDQSANFIWAKDAEGRFLFVNRRCEEAFGISRELAIGKRDHDLFPKPIAEELRANDSAVMRSGLAMEFEERVPKEDRLRIYISNKFPMRDAKGKISAVCGIATDITERKRAEDFLEVQIQRRTKELLDVNSALETEIAKRKRVEETLRRSQEQLRTLAGGLQAAHEAERSFLAREIHDELSGTLTALKMDISLLPERALTDRKRFAEKLRSMSEMIDQTLARVQSIVTELRPVILDKFGLVAAIEWQASEFQARSGIVCEVHLPDEKVPVESERATAIFRILQEALTNVARHAGATKVFVDLRYKRHSLILAVRDNGKGIDERVIYAHGSIGLLGMRERALSFGGSTKVTRLPKGGTLVTVKIPTK